MDTLEQRTMARVSVRLVPFLIVCYFVAYLDRVNVSFAALTMNKDLGLSASAYGLGAGIFFLAYGVFEVPSNLLLAHFGARRWISRIMVSWGIVSGAMAFVGNETWFYVVRFLLGAAEAGFFPGMIFYLTLWFPAAYRAGVIGYFMAAIPLSTVIGAPVSSAMLSLDGILGMHGWQWLFILEAAPALLLSVVVLFFLTDRPADAGWLSEDERRWLTDRLATEERQREAARHYSVLQALLNPRVLALSLVYFGAVAANYGLSFFLPQIVKAFGMSNLETGFVAAIPYAVGVVGIVWWGRHSDAKLERRFHTGFAIFVAAAGLTVAAFLNDPAAKMVAFSVAGFGIFGCLPVFWTLPTAFLSGAAAAGGIAIINSIGNLAGFVGPSVMGMIKDSTGSFTDGLLVLAGVAVVAVIIVLLLPHETALERVPALETSRTRETPRTPASPGAP
jgi:MFS transporter, ACS family, tartrate transporter